MVQFAQDETEWKLRSADFEGQIAAIGRTQAVISFTPDGVVTAATELFLQVVGYTFEQVIGQHHRLFMDPDAAARPEYERFWADLRRGIAQQGEFKHVGKGGSEVWLSSSYTPICGPSGRVVKVVAFARDTSLRNADFEGQIAAIGRIQAVASLSPDGVILDANGFFLRAFGYTREEVVGRSHRMLLDETSSSPAHVGFWSSVSSDVARSGEFKMLGKAGLLCTHRRGWKSGENRFFRT